MLIRSMEKISGEFRDRDSELLPKALAQSAVVLRATEKVAHQGAKRGAAAGELDHARGDSVAEESAAKNEAHKARGNFEVSDKFRAQARRIAFRLALHDGLREQVAGTKRVKQSFAGDGIDARSGVSRERPVWADDFPVPQRAKLRRRQDVAVKARAFGVNFFLVNEIVEKLAQFRCRVFCHGRADSDRQMIGAREGPQIAVHAVEKFDFDDFVSRGNEIAQSDLEILRAKGSGVRQQLISRASGEYNKVGGVFLAAGGKRDAPGAVLHAGFDLSDARVNRLAAGGCGAVEEQAVEHGARINHDGPRHLKTRSMAFAGNQFRDADFFFGLRAVQQERVFLDGLVGEAAAAGLFPGEMFIKERDVEARARKFFAAKGAGRPSANYGNLFHSVGTSMGVVRARDESIASQGKRPPLQKQKSGRR